jgi:hypothetical protein
MHHFMKRGLTRQAVKVMIKHRLIAVSLFVFVLTSCSESQETRAVCSHAAELESSLVATEVAVESFSTISRRQLQSTVAVLTGTLSIINDIAPSAVKPEVEQTKRAYEELSVALQNVYWDGKVAEVDANVQNAIENLVRNDNVESLEALRAFIAEECKVEISQGINAAPGDDQSVSSTSLVVDPQPDINHGFDNEETAIRSYAYFIAEQRGLAITSEQAMCLGTRMISVAENNPTLSDDVYEATLTASFSECGIAVN